MKLITKSLTTLMLAAGLMINVSAQDMHLSQFDAAPLFFNPALSGNYDGLHRFIGNWKSQWSTYGTGLLSYDKMLPEEFSLASGKFGVGAMVLYDRAGETKYGYTSIKLMPSYHVPIIPNNILFLSAGLDVTMTNISIDETKVITGEDIDPNTGESKSGYEGMQTSVWNTDVGAGINAYTLIDEVYPVNLGITLHHLFRSGKSSISEAKLEDGRRFSVNANSILKLSDRFAFLPSLIWIKQAKYNQINVGTFAKYSFTKTPYAVLLGAWYRINDAAIVGAAVEFPGIKPNHLVNLGVSYDITASEFNVLGKEDKSKVKPNSFEISLKYIIRKGSFKYTPPAKLNPVNF